MWPGQFIGLTTNVCSSAVVLVNMFSPKVCQWPEASHSERDMSSGVLTSR